MFDQCRMTKLGSVLLQARKRKNMVQREVADAIGVSTAAVGQWERGPEVPSTENLIKVCKVLGIDAGQAIVGIFREVGVPRGDDHISSDQVAASLDYDTDATFQESRPFSDAIAQIAGRMGAGSTGEVVTIQAGDMQTVEPVSGWWRVPPTALRNLAGVAPQHIAGWPMEGDSMEPTIKRTDVVFIDTRRQGIEPDGIWAVDYGLGRTLKRINVRRTPNGPVWVLTSDNPIYEPQECSPEEVTVFGRYLFRFTAY